MFVARRIVGRLVKLSIEVPIGSFVCSFGCGVWMRIWQKAVEVFLVRPAITRRSGEVEHSLGCPTSCVREHRAASGCVVIVSSVVQEAMVPRQRDVIEAEVEERRVHHAESGKGKQCAYDGTGEDIVPVVDTFDCEDTALNRGVEEGSKDEHEFP